MVLYLQHAAAHLCHLQNPPSASVIAHLASVYLLWYFFLHCLHFVFVFGTPLAGTCYRPAALLVTKPSVAQFATSNAYHAHAGVTPPI